MVKQAAENETVVYAKEWGTEGNENSKEGRKRKRNRNADPKKTRKKSVNADKTVRCVNEKAKTFRRDSLRYFAMFDKIKQLELNHKQKRESNKRRQKNHHHEEENINSSLRSQNLREWGKIKHCGDP